MKRFYLLIGNDSKKIDFNVFKILDDIKCDENSKIVYDNNEDTFMSVIEEASIKNLFSSLKVIIVNNFNIDKINEYEYEYFSKFIDINVQDVYMIFITDKVDARKKSYKLFKDNFKIIELDKVDNLNVLKYIKDKIVDNGYKISDSLLDYLFSKLGNDINNINNELDKLFIYKCDDKIINREDIDLLIFDNIDNVIYEFTNAIMEEDYDKIKIMYDKFMLDNIGIDYLIISIYNSFRINYIIKYLYNKNISNLEISKVINKKEFFVKKSLERLYRYSFYDLGEYLNKLYEIDRNIKSGNDKINSFELFLFSK